MGRGKALIYTDEIKEFIVNNQFGISRQELTLLINSRFHTDYTAEQIKSYCSRNKLKNGISGYFVKGQPSYNKGVPIKKEMYEKLKGTMFNIFRHKQNQL